MHADGAAVYHALPFLLISGIFLFGVSKILWIESIHRISVTKANALESIAPLFTIIFAWIILQQQPTLWQALSFAPSFIGVLLLTNNLNFKGYFKKEG